jgi:hypothetical protein
VRLEANSPLTFNGKRDIAPRGSGKSLAQALRIRRLCGEGKRPSRRTSRLSSPGIQRKLGTSVGSPRSRLTLPCHSKNWRELHSAVLIAFVMGSKWPVGSLA